MEGKKEQERKDEMEVDLAKGETTGQSLSDALKALFASIMVDEKADLCVEELMNWGMRKITDFYLMKEEDFHDVFGKILSKRDIRLLQSQLSLLAVSSTGSAPLVGPADKGITGGKLFHWGPPVGARTFHVPLEKLSLPKLLDLVSQPKACVLVHGSFRTGKTSHLIGLAEKLAERGVIPIRFTMSNAAIADFFQWLSGEISFHFKQQISLKSAGEMQLFFESSNPLFQNRRVVLLFDEFQLIDSLSDDSRRTFFAFIKRTVDTENLIDAFVGFGTFSQLSVASADEEMAKNVFKQGRFSPFTYEKSIFLEPLPLDEVSAMFNEWAEMYGFTLEAEVASHIHNLTGGYPGLIGFIGQQLHENVFLTRQKHVTMEFWQSVSDSIFSSLLATNQFRSFHNILSAQPKLREFIQKKVIPFPSFDLSVDDKDLNFAILLADYGLLRISQLLLDWSATLCYTFVVFSPLLRQFMILRTLQVPPNLPLFDVNWLADPCALLENLLPFFNSEILSSEECRNRTTGFPSEYSFQAELFAILRSCLANVEVGGPWKVFMEAKSLLRPGKRVDVLIRNGKSMLLELKAKKSVLTGDALQKAAEQAAKYALIHRCDIVAVVNFTQGVWDPIPPPVVSVQASHFGVTSTVTVKIIHVACSDDFTVFKLY